MITAVMALAWALGSGPPAEGETSEARVLAGIIQENGLSTGHEVYLLPLSPADDVLVQFRIYGLVRIYGGTPQTSVVTLTRPGRLETVLPLVAEVLSGEASWLAQHAVNNKRPPFSGAAEQHRVQMARQRFHAGRMYLAALVCAHALEPEHAESAARLRSRLGSFASLAHLLGDLAAAGSMSEVRFARFQKTLTTFASAAHTLPSPQFDQAADRLFRALH
jgi:hypothetical protein